jgi:hypothetical protein
MTKKTCPLGEDCDLTIAWMKGAEDARDKIKELEAELNLMKTSGIAEVAVKNPSVMEYMKHWEGRAETAEAKLAKAVEALDRIAGKAPYADDPYDIARATLAELTGDKP